MDALFEIYGSTYPIVRTIPGRQVGGPTRRFVGVTAVMSILCLAGIAFNLRFLIALCQARQLARICADRTVQAQAQSCCSEKTINPWLEQQENGLNFDRSLGALDHT